VKRTHYLQEIENAFKAHPVVAILGPRQCGKSTLAQQYAQQHPTLPSNIFDLENPLHLAQLEENASFILNAQSGLIIIDEIQYLPNLFKLLRVIVDQDRERRKFLILGSASRDLIHQSSETLAGRVQYIELSPLSAIETQNTKELWNRGGFPLSFLAENDLFSSTWRNSYIKTYLERDIPNLGFKIPAKQLRRFWMMLSHYHGNIFNASELGKSLGVASTTIKRYLDILTGTFMVRELQPWFENINKRQVKSPKIYIRDSGIYHSLLSINNHEELLQHPKLSASWEGFALEEIIKYHQAEPDDCYFWAIHNQCELDLLLMINGKRLGFEFKFSDKPKHTPSMAQAIELLQLDQLTLITPGEHQYQLSEKTACSGLSHYLGLKTSTQIT
jgi:predicted AAA+ superfamily ATPase